MVVDSPNAQPDARLRPKVLELRPRPPEPPAWSERSLSLIEAFAILLRVPQEIALQQALTHALSCVERRQPLHLVLPFESAPDHNPGSDDV